MFLKFLNNILIFKQISNFNNFSKHSYIFLFIQNVLHVRKNNLKIYINFLKIKIIF